MIVVWGLLGLCVIVVAHEAGHFIAAKLTGVEVETFSIGMGPVLLRKKIGKTEFRLSLLPLGGYCGLKGDNAYQKALESNLSEIPKEKGSFFENPIKRFLIAIGGPIANVIFAIIAFTAIALIGYTYQSTEPKIIIASEIYPEMSSKAAECGMKSGDVITKINNEKINTFNDLYTFVSTHPDEILDFTVLRGEEELKIQIKTDMDKDTASGKIGVVNWIDTKIVSVAKNSFAEKIGIKKDDFIVAVDNIDIKTTAELQKYVGEKRQFTLTINRLGELIEIPVKFVLDSENLSSMGIAFPSVSVLEKETNFFKAIGKGFSETFEMIALTLKTITYFFKGINISEAVSGPVRITVMLGEATKAGFSVGFAEGVITVLNFLALISVSLFVMNLLPIPVLDGGIALFALIEIIRKKGVSPKFLYRFQIIGFVLIAFLFFVALSSDLTYLFKK